MSFFFFSPKYHLYFLVLDTIDQWLDEFKPLKGMLKDYFEARTSRDHYVSCLE